MKKTKLILGSLGSTALLFTPIIAVAVLVEISLIGYLEKSIK